MSRRITLILVSVVVALNAHCAALRASMQATGQQVDQTQQLADALAKIDTIAAELAAVKQQVGAGQTVTSERLEQVVKTQLADALAAITSTLDARLNASVAGASAGRDVTLGGGTVEGKGVVFGGGTDGISNWLAVGQGPFWAIVTIVAIRLLRNRLLDTPGLRNEAIAAVERLITEQPRRAE